MNSSSQVLIVDDNPFNRELLKRFIETEGFGVVESRNGKEALEQVENNPFSLIFMDLLMPGMDGYETMRRIRGNGVTTPIIIVSSMNSQDDRNQCKEAGANDFLPKPIDIQKVKEIIRKYAENGKKKPQDIQEKPMHNTLDIKGYRVLLVEEDEKVARRFEAFLLGLHMEVEKVANGSTALLGFQKNKYDLIISNVFTTGIDGIGILARIKRDYVGIPVFVYARDPDPDTFRLAIQLGADGVVSEAEFEEKITGLLESAIHRFGDKGSPKRGPSTSRQVRKAQERLIRFGCNEPCGTIDIAYETLSDAGGDIACCSRFNLAGRCGITLGDVSGHNVMSSYISAISFGILTSSWQKNQKPERLFKTMNQELNKPDYDQYHLCATSLLWDRMRENISVSNAGNPGAILFQQDGDGHFRIKELTEGGMCLGLIREDHLFISEHLHFPENACLFLFSDGIEPEEIKEVLLSGKVNPAGESIRGISREILDLILETKNQKDDMILVTLKADSRFFPPALRYSFPADYKSAESACKWAADQLIPDSIPNGHDPYFVLLALREGVINSVKHANTMDAQSYIDIALFVFPEKLVIEISDEGEGIELPDNLQKINEVDILQDCGRGIPVMYSVSDEFQVDGGSVQMIFHKRQEDEN